MLAIRTSERNGKLMGVVQVKDGNEIMLISDQGTMVRTRVDEVSVMGRDTQGVTLIRLGEGEHLVGIERIEEVSSADVEEAIDAPSLVDESSSIDDDSASGADDNAAGNEPDAQAEGEGSDE